MPGPEPSLQSIADPTRQQLDELDALMQQMLALPVNPTDSPESPSPAPDPGHSAKISEQPSTSDDPQVDSTVLQPEQAALACATERLETESPARMVPSFDSTLVVASATESATQVPEETKPAVVKSEHPRTRPVSGNRLLWVINQAFDACTLGLGPVGRCLRTPIGRACLGWTGALLLAAALIWALLDASGWTW